MTIDFIAIRVPPCWTNSARILLTACWFEWTDPLHSVLRLISTLQDKYYKSGRAYSLRLVWIKVNTKMKAFWTRLNPELAIINAKNRRRRRCCFSLARRQVYINYCGPLAPPIVCYGFGSKPIRATFADWTSQHRKPSLSLIGRSPSCSALDGGLGRERGGRGYFNGRQWHYRMQKVRIIYSV